MKTKHSGAKRGGGEWCSKADAKRMASSYRWIEDARLAREAEPEAIDAQVGDVKGRHAQDRVVAQSCTDASGTYASGFNGVWPLNSTGTVWTTPADNPMKGEAVGFEAATRPTPAGTSIGRWRAFDQRQRYVYASPAVSVSSSS